MGVRGLQSYLEQQCKSASPFVNIKELVERRRRCFSEEQLVIVVDGSSCIRLLYGNLEWVGGGQLKQFGDKAKDFVKAFEDIGVRLVFFFDGPTVEKKRKTWVDRRYSTVDKMYAVLDLISEHTPSHAIPKNLFHLPPGMGQLSRVIFEIICQCEVYQSLTECDEEIAEYARNNQAFAILGQDSDFVILDGGEALYLSMQHLNLQKMSTRLYDRKELCHNLHIHPSQLPLLATFMGNDIVTADELKPFHCRLTGQRTNSKWVDFKILVPSIAMYIRTLPPIREQLYDMLSDVSVKVLGHRSRERDIRASLLSYDPLPRRDYERREQGRRDRWSQLVAEARRRHVTNKLPSMVYAVMNEQPYESSTSIEDFRKNDLPTFASATRRIRQRVYGILLQEKPLPASGVHEVEEWCMAGPGSLDRAHYVDAVPPRRRHPGLRSLWTDRGQLLSVRWQLFVSSVSPKLDVHRVRSNIPPYLVIPTLILYFINELQCLDVWEVDAMLATATTLKYYNVNRLKALSADPILPRGIRVANLIMRCTFILYFLLATCGYPLSLEDSAPWLFFDGKLFQTKYREARSKQSHSILCEHKVDVLEDFYRARQIIFDDSNYY